MKLLILLAVSAVAWAQSNIPTFTGVYTATLAAATGATTLQNAAAPTKGLLLQGLSIYCSAACTWTLDAGMVATATLGTTANVDPANTTAATARVYTASNAAAGVTINTGVVGAGGTTTLTFLDPKGISNTTIPKSTSVGITLRFASMTGDVKVTWMWREQ